MNSKFPFFITDAVFSEIKSFAHKPVFVPGREFNSLSYRYSGEVMISANGKTYRSVSDTITFMPENLPYKTEVLKDTEMCAVHFNISTPILNYPVVLSVKDRSLSSLFKMLTKPADDLSSAFSKMSTFYEILSLIYELNANTQPSPVAKKAYTAKEIIDLNFSDPYLSVFSIAEKIGVSTSYLRKDFSASYGCSPIKYLKELRIRQAKNMLLYENRTVADTAKLCGYTSTSYFIQDFHKATGISPDKYRNRFKETP